jgi:ketosteroid isomerase-like protein
MSSDIQQTERAKEIVKAFYDGGARGHITDFAEHLADDFELFVPDYLPWGGRFDKAGYIALLPGVAKALDFGRIKYLSFIAEGGHVVALIEIGVRGTGRRDYYLRALGYPWRKSGAAACRLLRCNIPVGSAHPRIMRLQVKIIVRRSVHRLRVANAADDVCDRPASPIVRPSGRLRWRPG